MKSFKQSFSVLALVCGMIFLSACGNNVLSALKASDAPQLDAIVAGGAGTITGTLVNGGFSSSNPYWVFSAGSLFSTTYLAPAPGIVSESGTTTLNGSSVTYLTIIHSQTLATRIYGIQTVLVRPNDYVLRGQQIGVLIGSGNVGFQVLYNNVPVCPLTYMTTQFRAQLAGALFTSTLCQ